MSALVLENFETSVSCVELKAPYKDAAVELITYFKNNLSSDFARVYVCSSLFHKTESLLLQQNKNTLTVSEYTFVLRSSLALAKTIDEEMNGWRDLSRTSMKQNPGACSIEEATQEHYGDLFCDFDNDYYFNIPTELLKARLERNNIDYSFLNDSKALDCGCGNGRYTNALQNLGCSEIFGIDFSTQNIETAKKYLQFKHTNNYEDRSIHFLEGDVLEIPFQNNCFEFVFSNGVLHHTRSIVQGIKEIYRVLKVGGKAWFYLLGKPCGIRMDSVEISRYIMKDIAPKQAINILSSIGISKKKILFMLDHILVPINTLTKPKDMKFMLEEQGFKKIQRLHRGADNDATEIKHRNNQMKETDMKWIFGEPELRYIAEK